ncbi:MAG: hypothetical protein ACYCY0_09960 [Acidithiobacillus ferrivorans]
MNNCWKGTASHDAAGVHPESKFVELSPIIPLLAGLDQKQREICVSAGAMVKRQQQIGQWGGNLVMSTMDRNHVLMLPVLPIAQKSIKAMGIAKILAIRITRIPAPCCMRINMGRHGAFG